MGIDHAWLATLHAWLSDSDRRAVMSEGAGGFRLHIQVADAAQWYHAGRPDNGKQTVRGLDVNLDGQGIRRTWQWRRCAVEHCASCHARPMESVQFGASILRLDAAGVVVALPDGKTVAFPGLPGPADGSRRTGVASQDPAATG